MPDPTWAAAAGPQIVGVDRSAIERSRPDGRQRDAADVRVVSDVTGQAIRSGRRRNPTRDSGIPAADRFRRRSASRSAITIAPASAAASAPFWTIRCWAQRFPPSTTSPTRITTASRPPDHQRQEPVPRSPSAAVTGRRERFAQAHGNTLSIGISETASSAIGPRMSPMIGVVARYVCWTVTVARQPTWKRGRARPCDARRCAVVDVDVGDRQPERQCLVDGTALDRPVGREWTRVHDRAVVDAIRAVLDLIDRRRRVPLHEPRCRSCCRRIRPGPPRRSRAGSTPGPERPARTRRGPARVHGVAGCAAVMASTRTVMSRGCRAWPGPGLVRICDKIV